MIIWLRLHISHRSTEESRASTKRPGHVSEIVLQSIIPTETGSYSCCCTHTTCKYIDGRQDFHLLSTVLSISRPSSAKPSQCYPRQYNIAIQANFLSNPIPPPAEPPWEANRGKRKTSQARYKRNFDRTMWQSLSFSPRQHFFVDRSLAQLI